jgi:hypothetical protein
MAETNQWDNSLESTLRHENPSHGPILTPVEARQGVVSGRVRLILAVSLMLAIVAGAIIYGVEIY